MIDEVVKYVLELGYLSDARYAASQARQIENKGYGEQRLRQQLKEKRVAEEVIEQALAEQTIDWFELAKEVAHKKFKSSISHERSQYAKQVRYLQYRGFFFEQIRYAIQASESDE